MPGRVNAARGVTAGSLLLKTVSADGSTHAGGSSAEGFLISKLPQFKPTAPCRDTFGDGNAMDKAWKNQGYSSEKKPKQPTSTCCSSIFGSTLNLRSPIRGSVRCGSLPWKVQLTRPALGHLLSWDDGDLLGSSSWVQAHLHLAHVKHAVRGN